MKIYTKSAVLAATFVFGGLFAQAQDLPKPSPAAKSEQRIGLTDVSVTYSRPSVKDRKIWGELVPYGELWRTGANASTLFTTSDNIKFGGVDVKAGEYALFAIPGEKEWTVILNTVTDGWGTGKYKKENNVASITVTPKECAHVESMLFSFDNLTSNSGHLMLSWEKVMIAIPIEVDVHEKAMANIEAALAKDDAGFRVYRNSAVYCVESNTNLDQAMKWIEKSISMENSWYSWWVKADVQAARGDNKGAVESGMKAVELGEAAAKEKGTDFTYKKDLEAEIAKWKAAK